MRSVINKFVLLFCFFIQFVATFAQPANYYITANGLTGSQLKVALHEIIDDHNSISYTQIWTAFRTTDKKSNGKVWDIYSDVPNGSPAYQYNFGDNQCGSYSGEGDCYNREHSWPQSWFNDATPMKTDLFHIYPTDGYVNGRRSNYPFGEVGSASYVSSNGSKLGNCITSGYSGTVFEPIDEYKGDLARSLFYMSVRYYSEDGSWSSSGMTNRSTILPWAITMLLRWHEEDPVSQKEIDRNNAIYAIQGNRNPFIDNPNYAPMIWDPNWSGTTYNVAVSFNAGGRVSPSGNNTVNEGGDFTFTVTPFACYDIQYVEVNGEAVSLNANGSYTITIIQNDQTVYASFSEAGPLQITSSSGMGGIIAPNGTIEVNCGEDATYLILPDDGYRVANVIVDNVALGALTQYTFNNVDADHTISATFVEDGVTSCDPPLNVTAVVDKNTVNLTWDAVYGATDYEIFRNGENVAIVSGTTSYSDNYLEVGDYCYTIEAYCMEGISDLSEESCVEIIFHGVADDAEEKIQLFPNPVCSGSLLQIIWDGSDKIDKVTVYDLSGRAVQSKMMEPSAAMSVEIPEQLQRGFYLVCLQQGSNNVATLKLIVK